MKEYTVKITDKALHDMEQIYAYIAETLDSPENGMNQYNRITKAVMTLSVFPERIRLLDTKLTQQSGLRRLLVDNYSVFFVIMDMEVVVIRVLYSASDIAKRLEEE